MIIHIYGEGLRSFVTAVSLCTLGYQVKFWDQNKDASQRVVKFDFEFSLLDLWNINVQKGQISFFNDINEIDSDDSQIHWFFYDQLMYGFFDDIANNLIQGSPTSHHNFVLSGLSQMGTAEAFQKRVQTNNTNSRVSVFQFPFIQIREGRSIHDFLNRKLLVIGSSDDELPKIIRGLFAPIIKQANAYHFSDLTTAELSRSTINAMLATRLSLMNEIADIAEMHQVDVKDVVDIVSSDSRIGEGYLLPGCGFGGKTLPAELDNLKQEFSKGSAAASLISAVQNINESQKELLFQKFWRYFKTDVAGRKVAVWGGAYKAGSGRTHNSPVHSLLKAFWSQGIQTFVYDSQASKSLNMDYANEPLFSLSDTAYDCLEQADALIITGWNSAELPDFDKIKSALKQPVIFDGRNLFNSEEMAELGIEYFGVGHGLSI